ncbi:unnamed protein product [Ectocarpus sp. 12 AP-2014]
MEVVAPPTDGLAAPPPPEPEKQMPTILCCMCSLPIPPNPTSMCVLCIRTQVDITEGIATNLTMHQCRGCQRYLRPGWVECKLESRELMAVCLRKISGLKKVKLVDASWIWTEPHSRRLKVKLTVQKEVGNGAVLQQAMVVTFVVRNQQCDTCAAAFTNNTWTAVVQVRQRVDHKRTFFYLEQLILKHNAHSQCTNIQTFKDGMDFYFTEKSHSARFVDFLEGVVPTKASRSRGKFCFVKHSKKLVSADNHSNIFNFHYTYLVTLVPVCKDDLVLLPKRLAESLGNISRLAVAQRITSAVQFVDPLTAQTADVTEEKYWRYEFPSLLSSTRLVPYVVLGTEPLPEKARPSAPRGHRIRKARVAEVELARECDLGRNDDRATAVSHLGHILRAGDTVLGYDVSSANLPEGEATGDLKGRLPDVVLVRKVYPRHDREGGGKADRHWKLGELEKDGGDGGGGGGVSEKRDEAAAEKDYERFLQQLESDKDMRRQVNLYKQGLAAKPPPADGDGAMEDVEEMDEEEVRLDELLDAMTLDNANAGPDGEEDLGAASASIFEAGTAPAPNAELLLDDDPQL